jgi:HJR/Mrr/RecB family endonuclease
MSWLKNLIFGNGAPTKQATPQKDLQVRHLRDSLTFAKQNRIYDNNVPAKHAAAPQTRYLRDTLAFAKQQRNELHHKQNEHERWQRHYRSLHVDEFKKLSRTEFEDYLAELFKSQGYQVEMIPSTGGYDADLFLCKDQQRTTVQAKCYTGSVGVAAVQETLSGMAYYNCHSAWVVTTGNYTVNAVELAKQSKMQLFGSYVTGKLILQMQNPTTN